MAFPFSLTYNSGTGIPISDTFDQWRIKTVAIGTDLTNLYNNLNTVYSDIVTLSGTQTISGAKTFTANPKIQGTTPTLTFSAGSGTDATLYRPPSGGLYTDVALSIGGSSVFTPGATPTASLPATTIVGNLSQASGYTATFGSPATFNGTLSITGNTALTNLLFMSGSGAIAGGTINNTTIGATTPKSGRFTTLTATSGGTISGGTSISGAYIDGGTINGTPIGSTSSAAGTFSTLTSPSVTITGGTIAGVTITGGTIASVINNTPIGATTANTGRFTTLTATTALIAPWTIAQRITETLNAAAPDATAVGTGTSPMSIKSNNTGKITWSSSASDKVTIVPKSATSKIKVIAKGKIWSAANQDAILAIFVRNSADSWPGSPTYTADAAYASEFSADEEKIAIVEFEFSPGNLTPRDIYVTISKSTSSTCTFNRQALQNYTYTPATNAIVEVTEYYQ